MFIGAFELGVASVGHSRSLINAPASCLAWLQCCCRSVLWPHNQFPSRTHRPRRKDSDLAPTRKMVVSPPRSGDSKMAEPAPRHIDPGLVERPVADRRTGDRQKPGWLPSRQDDCRGSAADCKQTTAR